MKYQYLLMFLFFVYYILNNIIPNQFIKQYILELNPIYVSIFPGKINTYHTEDWPTFKIFTDNFLGFQSQTKMLVTTDTSTLNRPTFEYVIKTHYLPVDIVAPQEFYNPIDKNSLELERLLEFDYILTKDGGDVGIFANQEFTKEINNYIRLSKKFTEIKQYKLPDESNFSIYKKIL